MSLVEAYPWLRSLWTLWFFLLFVGIIVWVMWPGRRSAWDKLGRIPLQEDDAQPQMRHRN
ncbi:cbb3-type cytochrome c oxidase subunit 3 [Ferrovibrio sp.]|uniref:cbb3-type cytochrome oxidase subunit 3 n=1 Tax=Ferrovibrio sp. TaxID=1917215 RepID=UPI0025C6E01C|nr:cbb3-type cytochrome c oxidase subunit 3 [Ferrovibrio sp.]MBX3454425.1 cbb3-type cytochrome c oxidase subunit 3 [Ferrovibrio sp.]